ncbi:3-phosphoshikimate 1-carboxyvinyltransferase, partial [Candidatus Sumerlaeota bacterium]|nr:3-phosphoshikimate 1-carboxyvinyltransferase [Candidatus Sumerlaeota bacterium]
MPCLFAWKTGVGQVIRPHAIVHPTSRLCGAIEPPSSKNYTTRYLLVAALADGVSKAHFPARSDDADAMLRCVEALGAGLRWETTTTLAIRGFGNHPRNPGRLDPGNAGAVLRFLMGIGALLDRVEFVTQHTESLGQRPHSDLLDALEQLGARCRSAKGGRLPITIEGGRLHGGKVSVSGARSSQFLSSLLFLAPLIGEPVEIEVIEGLKSKPLIRTTLEVIRSAGVEVRASDDLMHFEIPEAQQYRAGEYAVNGDWPGASAILAAAAVTESEVTISRLYDDEQGERAIVDVLGRMGADVAWSPPNVTVRSTGHLSGVSFDGDRATDAVLAMAGAACLARGRSRFFNVGNLRLKECDRISEPLAELRKLGVECREEPDAFEIVGSPGGLEGGVEVEAHNDHRVIMLLTIVALRCRRPVTILDAHHVAKSY